MAIAIEVATCGGRKGQALKDRGELHICLVCSQHKLWPEEPSLLPPSHRLPEGCEGCLPCRPCPAVPLVQKQWMFWVLPLFLSH